MAFGISAAEARLFLDDADDRPAEFGLWPCNQRAFALFMDLKTQWRHGPFGGIAGLEYTALPAVMDLRGIKRRQRSALFDALRAMEQAALAVFHKR